MKKNSKRAITYDQKEGSVSYVFKKHRKEIVSKNGSSFKTKQKKAIDLIYSECKMEGTTAKRYVHALYAMHSTKQLNAYVDAVIAGGKSYPTNRAKYSSAKRNEIHHFIVYASFVR